MNNENKGGISSFITAIIPLKIKIGILAGIIIFFLVILVPVIFLTVLVGGSEVDNEKESSTSENVESTGTATTQVIQKDGLLFPSEKAYFCYPVVGSAKVVQSFGASGKMWKNRSYRNRLYRTKRNKCSGSL